MNNRISRDHKFITVSAILLLVSILRTPIDTVSTNLHIVDFFHCLYVSLETNDLDTKHHSRRCEVASFDEADELNQLFRWKGIAALNNDESGMATRFFGQAVEMNQRDFISWWGLGIAYERQENYTAAIKAMVEARNPNYIERTLRAIERGEMRSIDGDTFAEAAIEEEIGIAEAYLFLAKRWMEKGEFRQATEVLQLVTKGNGAPDIKVEAHYLLGELIYENGPGEAEAHFHKALTLSSEDIEIYFRVVMFFLRENNRVKGWEWARQMEGIYPQASLTHDSLGWLYWLEGNETLALAHYETAVNAEDGLIKPWTYGRLGNIHMNMNRYDDAVSAYNSALEMTNDTSIPLAMNLTKAYLANKDCESADLLIQQTALLAGKDDLASINDLKAQASETCTSVGSEK